jgi:hypothetical protein
VGRNNHGAVPPFPPGTVLGGEDGGWYFATDCAMHENSTLPGALLIGPGEDPSRDGVR